MSPQDALKNRLEKINARYCRGVLKGDNTLMHHGDCYIYTQLKVCSCGLLHDLAVLDNPSEYFPEYLDQHCGELRAIEIHHRAREFVCEIHEILRHEHSIDIDGKDVMS